MNYLNHKMNASKRMLDLIICIPTLLIVIIPMILIGLIIRINSSGPAIYWSDRIGYKNQIFSMPKFRSMHINTPTVPTDLLQNPSQYITSVGKFLRESSLDELPQLWSILKGDMSFVGPRPALFNQKDLINLRTEKGIDILTPGLTGWAQVNGRDNISLEKKIELDQEYLEKKSISFDMYVIWLTILKVLSKDGVSH